MINTDIIQQLRQPIAKDFVLFEDCFSKALTSDNPLLNEVLGYIHTERGKQLRPILVLLAAAVCRGVTDKTILTATALELMHTASLVHDDVVDDSPLRRGNQAIQTKWNNKIAILVGDYLLSQTIRLLSEVRNNTILAIMSEMAEALACGELQQLHHGQSMWISEKQYLQVIEHKTAHLFAACGASGAVSSGASPRQITALKQFGQHVGICFQLQDDVLDYSDTEELGKPTMNDIRDGKATLPLLKSLERAPKEEANTMRELCESLATPSHVDVFATEQEIKSFVLRYDGISYAQYVMQQHKKKALEVMQLFPESQVKSSLLALLDYSINRVY